MNADGTRLDPIPFPVTVEEAFDVAPEWAIFCGTGEKVWTWDETQSPAGRVWGNGAYKASLVPDWWGRTLADISGELPGNDVGATMTFSASGAKLIKKRTDGIEEVGTFSFDMSKVIKAGEAPGGQWSIGRLYTNQVTVLNGKQQNVPGAPPLYEYEILKLNDNQIALGWATALKDGKVVSFDEARQNGAWSEAWYWFFKPVK